MAGGDFMQLEARKRLTKSNYECENDSRSIQQINPAIYIESFHDNSDDVNESDYLLDLSTLEPSTSRTTILTSDTFRNESTTDVRYINSAIFIERVDATSCDESECCEDQGYQGHQSTYRKDEDKLSQISKTYSKKLNGKSFVHMPQVKSATNFGKNLKSKSTSQADSYTTEDESRSRGMPFDEWLASKQQVTRKPKPVPEKNDTCRQQGEDMRRRRMDEQREDFKRWLATKREQDKMKKKEIEMQKSRAKQEEELKLQRAMEKESMLKSWIKRKDEQLKDKKRREEMVIKKREEEKKMRKELSAKAFEEWKERSQYKPKPVPLNMGVESLRGSVSALQFVNPTPWQENIDVRQSS